MKHNLTDILWCPVSHRSLYPASAAQLAALNKSIQAGGLCQCDGTPVTVAVSAALITDDKTRLYRVEDGLPVLIEEESILLSAIGQAS